MRAKMSGRLFLHSCIIFTYTGRNTQECTYVFLSNICMLGIRKSRASSFLPLPLFPSSASLSNRAFVFFLFHPFKEIPTTERKMLFSESRYSAFLRARNQYQKMRCKLLLLSYLPLTYFICFSLFFIFFRSKAFPIRIPPFECTPSSGIPLEFLYSFN